MKIDDTFILKLQNITSEWLEMKRMVALDLTATNISMKETSKPIPKLKQLLQLLEKDSSVIF